MKKIITLLAICIVAMMILTSCGSKSSKTSSSSSSNSTKSDSSSIVTVDACDILSATIAKDALGDSATKGDTSAGNVSTGDVAVSNCTYSADIQAGVTSANNTKGVSVLVRSAKTAAGKSANENIFGSSEPAGVQDVKNFGDQAFYNPDFHQLNILQGGNYYIVTSYSGNPLTGATLDSDEAFAKMLTFK